MDNEKQQLIEQYLQFCMRVAERMEREGSWPWATQITDSTDGKDLLDSGDNPTNI